MSTKEQVSECCVRPKPKVQPIAGRYELGEGPHWDCQGQKLYFVDIHKHKIFRWNYKDGSITSACMGRGSVGVVIPVENKPGQFVIGWDTNFTLIDWKDDENKTVTSSKILLTVDEDRSQTRWNDGKVDSSGRFYGGTMGAEKNGEFEKEQGSLYCIESNAGVKKLQSSIGISNGLAWSLEDDKLYYIDSLVYEIVAYDYDRKTGRISNKKSIFNVKENNIPGLPDGMTIDVDGNLWVALYFGGRIIQINPKTGKLLRSIEIPAKRVTSVAFGGPRMDELFVTTSSHGMNEEELKNEPHAGYLFKIEGLGVRGLPPNEFKWIQ